jgi:hypothetical protein
VLCDDVWLMQRGLRIGGASLALDGHNCKPLWFLLLSVVVVVAIAANNSGR